MRYKWTGFLSLVLIIVALLWFLRSFLESSEEQSRTEERFEEVEYRVEEVARNLYVPWAIVFTSPERMLVTERSGQVRVIESLTLQDEPLIDIEEVVENGEAGLMGIDIDPDYENNRYFYVSYTYRRNGELNLKVVRLRDNGESAEILSTVIDGIPAAPNHSGSRVKFGPDGKLYVTAGDASQPQLAQNLSSPAGKILRLNPDGSIPEDNPFPNSPVYSYGHRNPQGLDWDLRNQALWSTEHGPSGGDGPPGGDEVNLILPGSNYGWPIVSHGGTASGTETPKIVFTPAEAPASAVFYTSDVFPQLTNNFLFAALRGSTIWKAVVTGSETPEVTEYEELEGIEYGRIREIVEGPDGLIYFTTSNRDGRGSIRDGDDKVYRLIPQ